MFNAYRSVDFPEVNGIIVRLYVPNFWGRCTGKQHHWTIRVEDNTDGPFKVFDDGKPIVLIHKKEYGIVIPGSFVLYSNDEKPEGAKFSAVYNANSKDGSLTSSLFNNETYERVQYSYFANGDYREVRQDNAG